jgi:hypothetical protein
MRRPSEANQLNLRQARPQRTLEHAPPSGRRARQPSAASRRDADRAAQSGPGGWTSPGPASSVAACPPCPSTIIWDDEPRRDAAQWPSARRSSTGHRKPVAFPDAISTPTDIRRHVDQRQVAPVVPEVAKVGEKRPHHGLGLATVGALKSPYSTRVALPLASARPRMWSRKAPVSGTGDADSGAR